MSRRPEVDEELIARVRQGDLDAFNQIVAAYQDRIYNLCLRMLGSPEAAEDAAQETFISAYRNAGKLRGANVRSWLFRIASNTCIDEVRKRQRRPSVSLDRPSSDEDARPVDVPDEDPGPEKRTLQSELQDAVQQALLDLPGDQRLAVTLRDLEGFLYEEIADAMGISVGTVKSRISRGRARLREAIRERPELFEHYIRPISEGGRA
ncbi:MAG: sigma-70 family RNA polymerase sigma factor [Chloroflexi bacterium]|nr:sigma-70 family RNA polymerase sigma factor [Chloroflexota bacterium]MCI0855512.1 sigma-70 family RNA polymerase sigma factor [Chloroflexota bacterium]MCI0890629.1 sigma-70 family RNA polymerase sigma factor [Chloroflexota bacterium]